MTQVLDRIASFFATDVVAIYNTSEEQVFADAIPMKAAINSTLQKFDHPLEDSTVITDHIVINPDQVSLSLTIPKGLYKDTYNQIRQAYQSGDLFEVRTKAANFTNMLITGLPHEENPEKFDAIDMVLEMEETQFESVIIATLQFQEVARKDQATSVDRGEQNPADASSVAAQIFDQAQEFIEGILE